MTPEIAAEAMRAIAEIMTHCLARVNATKKLG